VNACIHTYTKPQTSSTRSRGLGRRIHGSVEDTKLSTNKQHSLSVTPRAPTRLIITRASRLGSLYYDKITTLAILPRRMRHHQPNESRQRPCGRAAGWRPPAARLARPPIPSGVKGQIRGASLPGAACSSNEYRPTRVVGGKRDQLPSVERYGAAVPRCPGHLSLS
jgi:hypothetical protein